MRDVVLKLMEKIDKNQDFEMFVRMFKNLPKMQFAVIKISGQTLENHLDVIAEDIAFLNKLEVFPVVIHGAGSVLDKKLPQSKKVNGIRVTSAEDMTIIKEVFEEINIQLVDKIKEKGGQAISVGDVFECMQMSKYGYVGDIKKVNLTKIKEAVDAGRTPVISPLGQNKDIYYNINADTTAKELAKAVNPKKFILLTETGGILDEEGKIVPFLNLSPGCDYDQITGGMLLKIEEIQDFLKNAKECSVVITSARNLLKEIFTIKGSGTFIKYHEICYVEDLNRLDKGKAKSAIESAFSKTMVDGYFENGIKAAFFEKNYEGIAIMKEVNGIPYLDKFAVAKPYQGTGLGKSLWMEITKRYPGFLLRAALDNPFNPFYTKHCDGMMKKNGWIIYWKNLSFQDAMSRVNTISEIKKTLITGDKIDGYKKREFTVSTEHI